MCFVLDFLSISSHIFKILFFHRCCWSFQSVYCGWDNCRKKFNIYKNFVLLSHTLDSLLKSSTFWDMKESDSIRWARLSLIRLFFIFHSSDFQFSLFQIAESFRQFANLIKFIDSRAKEKRKIGKNVYLSFNKKSTKKNCEKI